MKTTYTDDYYANLASKYLSGNTSPAEMEELENWVLASPENKQQFVAFKKAWMLAGAAKSEASADVEALWSQTSEKLFGDNKAKVISMKKQKNRTLWWSMAAAILVVIAVSFWLFQNNLKEQPFLAKTENSSQTFDLADGSQVVLNQVSSLRYELSEKGERRVELAGDAFFEVAKDSIHPFIIKTPNIEIEVLGTSFYVDARQNQPDVQVIVESGKVAVRAASNDVTLGTGEQAIYQKNTQQLVQQRTTDANFSALKTKVLIFKQTPLEQVVFTLNRQYNTNISIDSETLKSCEYSASHNNKSLDAILKVMKTTLGVEVEENGERIILKGNCNNN